MGSVYISAVEYHIIEVQKKLIKATLNGTSLHECTRNLGIRLWKIVILYVSVVVNYILTVMPGS